MNRLFFILISPALLLVGLFMAPTPAFAQQDFCPNVQDARLKTNCNSFYRYCTENNIQEPGFCAEASQEYVTRLEQYRVCVTQGGCANFNDTQQRAALREMFSMLVPNYGEVVVGTLPSPEFPPGAVPGPTPSAPAPTPTPITPTPVTPTNPQTGGAGGGAGVGGRDINMTYVPLEPLPGIDQTGQLNFGTFLGQIFKILIALGALITVGAFIYAGIAYMSSETLGKINDAKARLRAAFFGLLLLLGAWVILYTINPQLVTFSAGISQGGVTVQLAPRIQTFSTPTVTDRGGTIVPTIETPRTEATLQEARNNPTDTAAQAAAAATVTAAQAECVNNLRGVVAPAGIICTQDGAPQMLGARTYQNCAVIQTVTGSLACMYPR